jgi:Uncharacterized protein conserved in bacteria
MRFSANFIASVALTALLGACTAQKPVTVKSHAVANSKPQAQPIQRSYYHPPFKPLGERTVGDILNMYGAYATSKLKPYFVKAQVAYPPQAITLIALKQEKKLELWAKNTNGSFQHIRDYPIQAASGFAGPKLRQGDKQVPEGVYRITGLNPNSSYHLSMKINYPNEFDLFHAWQEGRNNPGSDIFIHGSDKSIGCLAMGDEAIEELFVLTAQVGAENVKVVIAPHDPRAYGLMADTATQPAWTAELYATIAREVNALTPAVKSVNSRL